MDSQACSGVRGDLLLAVDDFRFKWCDCTLQEADITEALGLDVEIYGYAKGICYLGDTLDGNGGADQAFTARIRYEWMSFLTSRAPLLNMKGRVHASCVRSSTI